MGVYLTNVRRCGKDFLLMAGVVKIDPPAVPSPSSRRRACPERRPGSNIHAFPSLQSANSWMAGPRPLPGHASPGMTSKLEGRVNHFVSCYYTDKTDMALRGFNPGPRHRAKRIEVFPCNPCYVLPSDFPPSS